MPAHRHPIPYPQSDVVYENVGGAYYGNFGLENGITGSTGGGAAHENKPAYYSLIFIKKMS